MVVPLEGVTCIGAFGACFSEMWEAGTSAGLVLDAIVVGRGDHCSRSSLFIAGSA